MIYYIKRYAYRLVSLLATIGPSSDIRIFFNKLRGVKIGKNCWLGHSAFLDMHLKHPDRENALEIGNNVSIGQNTHIYIHDSSDWQITGRRKPIYFSNVSIGDYTYIGPRALIINSKIGKHCVVAGHTVVMNQTVPDYSLVLGFPSKIIRKDKEEIIQLMKENDEGSNPD